MYIEEVVEIAAPPQRVFQAIASKEIVEWWVNPGVFDTREWTGDVRKGGRWRATGVVGGQPYALEGEFLEVDPPHKLVHALRARLLQPSAITRRREAQMWNKDEVQGKVDQVKGKIKESIGEMNDDEQLRSEGEAQHDAGHVEEAFGKGRRKVGEAIKDIGDKIGQ